MTRGTARIGWSATALVALAVGVVVGRGWGSRPADPPPPVGPAASPAGGPLVAAPAAVTGAAPMAAAVPVPSSPTSMPASPGERRLAVRFEAGHGTNDRDHGRPVVLIAAALNVPADVFRQTFAHVHPAGPASGGPTDAEARQNKATLMAGLSPYGVTDDRLNAVSNYYRYVRGRDQVWRHRPAVAYALVRPDGAVDRFDVTDAGGGYSTPPTATVDGLPGVAVTATLAFGTDLSTNGSIRDLSVAPPAGR